MLNSSGCHMYEELFPFYILRGNAGQTAHCLFHEGPYYTSSSGLNHPLPSLDRGSVPALKWLGISSFGIFNHECNSVFGLMSSMCVFTCMSWDRWLAEGGGELTSQPGGQEHSPVTWWHTPPFWQGHLCSHCGPCLPGGQRSSQLRD